MKSHVILAEGQQRRNTDEQKGVPGEVTCESPFVAKEKVHEPHAWCFLAACLSTKLDVLVSVLRGPVDVDSIEEF